MDAPRSGTFGDLLRRYRLAAGLTQEELAERAQISPRAISDLERGARNRPWRDTIQLLASALKLDASERTLLEAAARQAGSVASTQPAAPVVAAAPAAVVRTNLTTSPTPLIGRERERADLRERLCRRP